MNMRSLLKQTHPEQTREKDKANKSKDLENLINLKQQKTKTEEGGTRWGC